MMIKFKEFILESKETNPVSVNAYHGTGHALTHFDEKKAKIRNDFYGGGLGYFTNNKKVAHTYARSAAKETKTPHIVHSKLEMKNVFDTDHHFTGHKLKRLIPKDTETFARHAGLLNASNEEDKYHILNRLESGEHKLTGHQVFWGLSHGGTKTAAARKHLQKHGYDGLRYTGGAKENPDTHHDVYIPYHAHSVEIKHVEKV